MVFTDVETAKDSDALDRHPQLRPNPAGSPVCNRPTAVMVTPEPLATTLPLADDASGMNVAVSIWSDITSDGDHTTWRNRSGTAGAADAL
jgi:hypothetical protein